MTEHEPRSAVHLPSPAARSWSVRPTIALDPSRFRFMVVASLLLGHVPLALLMYRYPGVASLHALGTAAIGLAWALSGRRLERVAYAGAYVVGAEVLWRMTEAGVFWEFGKYVLTALLGLGLLRSRKVPRSVSLPMAYFLVLLPSIWLTIGALGVSPAARQAISFNLSGPLALSVSVSFLARQRLSWQNLRVAAWCAVIPTVGIATLTLSSMLAAGLDYFRAADPSAIVTSGFRDNQVAIALGLGAVLCVFLALGEKDASLRLIATGLAAWFGTQSLLTLSRGGVYIAAIALSLGMIPYLRRLWLHAGRLLPVVLIGLVCGLVIVVPRVNALTAGYLVERFAHLDTGGRIEIARGDLQLWAENTLLGVGVGMSPRHRQSPDGRSFAAHTEYTRLLAEHGVLGLLAMLLLVAMAWRAYRSAPSPAARACVLALAGWSLAAMSHSAMRTAAPAFLFGMMTIQWPRGAGKHQASRSARSETLGGR
jgi:O-Antigen ligase